MPTSTRRELEAYFARVRRHAFRDPSPDVEAFLRWCDARADQLQQA